MAILVECKEWAGESSIKGFEKQFEVSSFQFGVGRGIASARGSSKRESSMVSVSEITLTKHTDGVSMKLFEEALHGPLSRKVTINFVRTGGTDPVKYLEVLLEGCGISGYSVSSGGDRPTESISLNFDKIIMNYTPIGDDLKGSKGGYGWNLATATKA